MDKSRRGFVSDVAAVGLGVFTYGVAQQSVAGTQKTSIAAEDVLIAMPGDLYYAIPKGELAQYAVSKGVFAQEESRRKQDSDEVTYRGWYDNGSGPRRPPRTAALGVRG